MMKDAGHRACIEATLAHERTGRTPVNNFAVVTAARSAGLKVDEARWHPEISAKVSVDYALRTHSDFVKPVIDSQVIFADMGMEVRFPEDDYGSVRKPLVTTPEDIDELAFFDPSVAKECPKFTTSVVEALAKTSEILPEDLNICGLSWGPISTAGYIMGAENMILNCLMEPDLVKSLLKKVTPFVAETENTLIDAGATLMWMADPTSSEDLLSPDMFNEFSHDHIGEVIRQVKGVHKNVKAYVHICGNTLRTMEMLPDIGVDCFSLDHAVDIAQAKRKAGKRMTIMGNIDPVAYLMQGTPEAITDECYRMIDSAGQEGGYIIAPGCETPISSPDENVIAMCRAGTDYWKK